MFWVVVLVLMWCALLFSGLVGVFLFLRVVVRV